jgi:hypothetical protein
MLHHRGLAVKLFPKDVLDDIDNIEHARVGDGQHDLHSVPTRIQHFGRCENLDVSGQIGLLDAEGIRKDALAALSITQQFDYFHTIWMRKRGKEIGDEFVSAIHDCMIICTYMNIIKLFDAVKCFFCLRGIPVPFAAFHNNEPLADPLNRSTY